MQDTERKKNQKLQPLRFYSVSLETENISHIENGDPARPLSGRKESINQVKSTMGPKLRNKQQEDRDNEIETSEKLNTQMKILENLSNQMVKSRR